MTGVEAISNGVPAFKKPEPRNAAITLTWMAAILGTLFLGITLLATSYHIEANAAGNPTVIGQIAQLVFTGPLFFLYPVFQLATLFILTLAANTSYSDFPRLASLLARDSFLPHQFAFRGDRLAFSIGIVILAVLASLLVAVFKGDPTQLINLYAVGVFTSFTLSQGGMVHRSPLRALLTYINALQQQNPDDILTVILPESAESSLLGRLLHNPKVLQLKIALFFRPEIVVTNVALWQHNSAHLIRPKDIHHRFIVPFAGEDLASVESFAYARSISRHVTAAHVALDAHDVKIARSTWKNLQKHLAQQDGMQLVVIESPYRSLTHPLLAHIDVMHA
jgi:hypothetical protein